MLRGTSENLKAKDRLGQALGLFRPKFGAVDRPAGNDWHHGLLVVEGVTCKVLF